MANTLHPKNRDTLIRRALLVGIRVLVVTMFAMGITISLAPSFAIALDDSQDVDALEEPQAEPSDVESSWLDPLAHEVELTDDSAPSQESQTDEQTDEQTDSGIVVEPPDDNIEVMSQSSSYYYAALYPSGELRLGTSFPTNGYRTYWVMYNDDTDFPWRNDDYRYDVKKVTTVSWIKVDYAYAMFDSMSNVTSINLSKMDVSSCTSFSYMFWNCRELRTLDLSGWQIDDWHTTSTSMYYGCENLRSVKVGDNFRFCVQLPEYSVNGHTDWYSTKAKTWFTSYQIYTSRDRTADTYLKSVPAKSKRRITSKKVKATIATQAWTGKRIKPKPTVRWGGTKLKRGRDYKIVGYGKNKSGTKKSRKNWVKIKGIGRYKGKRKVYFTIKKPSVVYRAALQRTGWQGWRKNGKTTGTTGKGMRLEAVKIKLSNKPVKGGITYRVQVQGTGWQGWRKNGKVAGTTGKSLRAEAIKIKLTGKMAKKYNVYYRAYCQKYGWMGWAKNGKPAGTQGYGYRLEAIQIKLVPKGRKAPGSTKKPFRKKKDYYILKRDTWRFENFTRTLPKSIYQKCYGNSAGYKLWYYTTNDDGVMDGYCYGMALSPASIKKYKHPRLRSFGGASKLYNVSFGTRSSSLNMSAYRFIQYGQVAQFDDRAQSEKSNNVNNAQGLVNAARTHVAGGRAIVVSLLGPNGNHAIMPLSVTDTPKKTVIYMYDSNHPKEVQKFYLFKSGGKYRSWDYSDDYDYERFTWSTPAEDFKAIMHGGGRSSRYFGNTNLVVTTSDVTVESGGQEYSLSPNTRSKDVIPITCIGCANDSKTNLYWVRFNTQDMRITGINEDTAITVCAEDAAIEVEAQADCEVMLSTLDDKNCSVALQGNAGDSFEVSYQQFEETDAEPRTTSVAGEFESRGGEDGDVTTQGDNGQTTVKGGLHVRTSTRSAG